MQFTVLSQLSSDNKGYTAILIQYISTGCLGVAIQPFQPHERTDYYNPEAVKWTTPSDRSLSEGWAWQWTSFVNALTKTNQNPPMPSTKGTDCPKMI